MSDPKRHHYIPQVYLKQWEDSENLVWYYNKEKKTVAHRNKNSILYEKYLYSLTFREIYYLTPQEQEFFIEPLKPFDIYLDDNKLNKFEIINNLIKYDELTIKNKDGNTISRGQKGDLLEKVLNRKHPLIENKYNKIEDEWPNVVNFFENYRTMVFQNNIILPNVNILRSQVDSLLSFILATYTRNPYNMLHSLNRLEENHDMPLDNRQARTVFEKLQLLYLNGERQLFDMKKFDIHLIFAAPETYFFTSDNPVIIKGIEMVEGGFTGIFWFPLSPNILVSLSKKRKQDQILEPHIAPQESVNEFNEIIRQYAEENFVSAVDIHDKDFKFIYN